MLQLTQANRRYGRHKDKPDSRDKVLRLSLHRVLPLPQSHDEAQWLGPVRNQGQEGSCVGHGWAGHADWLFRKYGPHHYSLDLSPQFIYYKCREMDRTLPDDGGSTVRTGAKVFNHFGVAPETGDLYGPDTLNTSPSAEVLTDALNYKGGAYHRLPTLNDMKCCLASGYCFVDGIQVYESFESDAVASSGEVPMPDPNKEQSLGGHCTLTFGYDDNHRCLDGSLGALHKRNSWGTSWGEGGNFWLPYAYVAPYLSDAWILHLGPAWG
jgi:C1A family cysteine protease